MITQEQKREGRRTDFGLALFLAVIFLVGGMMFIALAVVPPDDLPSVSRWLIRIAAFIIAGVCLLFSLIFTLRVRFLLTGKRSFSIKFWQSDSDK
jgi:cell division protein FtsW (lipid II flippase)